MTNEFMCIHVSEEEGKQKEIACNNYFVQFCYLLLKHPILSSVNWRLIFQHMQIYTLKRKVLFNAVNKKINPDV